MTREYEGEAALRIKKRIKIGYVCRHGHFQFKDDPDGDGCQTKKIGTIYVKPSRGVPFNELREVINEAMTGLHSKIEFWRKNA